MWTTNNAYNVIEMDFSIAKVQYKMKNINEDSVRVSKKLILNISLRMSETGIVPNFLL